MKNAKPLKKKGAFFKLIGSSTLLLSFITQNFLYETWNAHSNDLLSASQTRAIVDKGALINETSFFVLSSSDLGAAVPDQKAVAEYKISQSALKLYQSEVIHISVLTSISTEEKVSYINELRAELAKVKDYASAAVFTDFINSKGQKYGELFKTETLSLVNQRKFAKWCYLIFYVIGAIFLLVGFRFEWLGAEE